MKALRTAAIVVGAVALVATGIGAAGTAGVLGGTIASGGAIAGGVTAATLTTIGTLAGVAAGVSSLAIAVAAGKPKTLGSAIAFTIDKESGQPVAFGRTYSAGRVVHRQFYGSKNSLESWVAVHSIGPIKSLGLMQINKVAVTFTGGAAQGTYSGFMWLDEQLGACPESRALAGPQGPFPGWTSAHKLSGLAADLWTLRFDDKGKKYPNGVPQRGRIIEGVLAWDPRLDSTYPGGMGASRPSDPSTHLYTENPWLLALQWARGFYQNGVLVAGGGLEVAGVDVAAFVDAANYADAVGWRAGGTVFTDTDNSWDVLVMLAQAGGGEVTTTGGILSCLYSSPKVSIGTITSADIIGDIDVPVSASRRLRRNTVIPRVRLESHGWEIVPLDAIPIPDYFVADGGRRPKEVDFPLVQQVDQGAQLGLYEILNARELDGIVLPTKVYAIGYRPGDCLTVDIPEASLNGRDVIVRGREIDGSTMGVTLTCRSETQGKHPFCLGKTGKAPPTPDLTVPPSYPVDPTRAAYLIVRQSVAYPVTSTATTIAVQAFDVTIDDGRTLSFPAQTITGLTAASVYVVLWDLVASTFVAVNSPALSEVASNAYVVIREYTTQNADGTYPPTPTAPGGDGGGGYGGGGCPVPEARVLLANDERTGPGETIAMGDLRAGMAVWSAHETTGAWGAWEVERTWRFDSPLFAVDGRPVTSPSHLWAVDPASSTMGWERMDVRGCEVGRGDVIGVTVRDAHTYVLVGEDGRWLLSHNKRADAPEL